MGSLEYRRYSLEGFFRDAQRFVCDNQQVERVKTLELGGVVITGGKSDSEMVLAEVPFSGQRQLTTNWVAVCFRSALMLQCPFRLTGAILGHPQIDLSKIDLEFPFFLVLCERALRHQMVDYVDHE